MSAPTSPPLSRRQKNRQIECKVLLLDDTILSVHIPVKGSGQVLYDEVIRKLQLLEADYFDLEYVDVRQMRSWLDHDKPVLRQLPRHSLDLRFVVKFYTPDPGQLEEDYTRYLFALQVRRDLASGVLPCQEHTAVLLASYIVQAELGDFSDELEVPGYLKDIQLLPRQTEELEQRIAEHHRDLAGQTPAVAEFNLLDTARKVDLYGIQTHPAKDHEGVPLHLAVAHLGVLVFQNQTKINTFSWAKIRKLSFKRKKFLVKLHPEGYGYYKDIVEFYFESRNDCKNFWKKCLEHHAFFRCHSVKRLPRNKTRLVSRGSSFRYCGRTQKQLAEYVRENCNRRPEFQRSTSMKTISLSHSVATTPKTGTLKSRADHHLSHPNIRSSSSSHAICVERAHARERCKHGGRNDSAPSRSLQTIRTIGNSGDSTRQAMTPPGGTKKGQDDSLKARRAQMELRNGTLDDFNLSYFKSGYNSDKQSHDVAYHDNMSQDSYQLMESHDSLDFDRFEPPGVEGAVDGNELCRQLEETREGNRTEMENQEEKHRQSSASMELDDGIVNFVKDGEVLSDLVTTERDGETAAEDGAEDRCLDTEAGAIFRGEVVQIHDEETALPDCGATGPPGHKVTDSPGHEVSISPARKVVRSPDHEVTISPGHKVKISPGHKVTSPLGHDGDDAKESDMLDSIEDVPGDKSTSDHEILSLPGYGVTISPGYGVTISPGHGVTISPGHGVTISPGRNSSEKFDEGTELEAATDSVRSVAEAESHIILLLTDSAALGQEVTRSPDHEATSQMVCQRSPEKSEVSAELETALEGSGDLADTLLPPGAGSSAELGQEEIPKSSTDLQFNGVGETGKRNGENERNEEASVVPHAVKTDFTSADSEFPYILHKRHLASKGEQTENSQLSVRSFRSRSQSPGKKKLTREEQRAELEKVKATLSSLAFQRKNPSPGNRRILDFVMYSKLPPRDSFSSKDDSISPTTLERALTSCTGKAGSGNKRIAKGKHRTDCEQEKPLTPAEADSICETSATNNKVGAVSVVFTTENQIESESERTLGHESLGVRTQGRYSNERTVGSDLTNSVAGEVVQDERLAAEASNSTEQAPSEQVQELSRSSYAEGSRASFPPNVVGVSMCSLEEFLMDVDLPAPIVESEEFDASSTSNSGEGSVLEHSSKDEEDVTLFEKEQLTLEERLAQVVLPPPPSPLEGGGVWNDDALNMVLYEPPAMLLFGNEGGLDGGGTFTVDDLVAFDALHSTDAFLTVTSSPIPSPPPPPFPWCDDVENSGLSLSEPTLDLEETLGSNMAVNKMMRIESSLVLRTSTGGKLPAGKDRVSSIEDNHLKTLSAIEHNQPSNPLPIEVKMDCVSSSQRRRVDAEQLCCSVEPIPLVRCSLEQGLSSGNISKTIRTSGNEAAGGGFLNPGVFSDQLVHGDISDEDDVEKPYTEHSLHDLYQNLEAEALAKPFHVPISADIPPKVFHSEDSTSASRSPDSYEIPFDSHGITELVPESYEESPCGRSHLDDNLLIHESLCDPIHVTVSDVVPCHAQTSLLYLGSSTSPCSSSTKP